MALTPGFARVLVQWRQPSELGRTARLDRAQLGHERQHRRAGRFAHTLDRFQASGLVLEVLLHMRIDVFVDLRDLLLQHASDLQEALAQHPDTPTQAVLLGRAHVHQLRPTHHQGLQFLHLLTGRGVAHTALIGLGQEAHAAGELARRPRVDHRHGQAVLQQVCGQSTLKATGGFEHQQVNDLALQCFEQLCKAAVVVAGAMCLGLAVDGPDEGLLRHVHADKEGRRCHRSLCRRSVCHVPSLRHAKCVRVTVRAWRQTRVLCCSSAWGRGVYSKGVRAVQAPTNRPMR